MRRIWVAYVFLAVSALALVFPSVIRLYPPLVGADRAYTVLSGSMSPALEPGDIVFVRQMEETQIDIGDIVTVESEGSDYTHRVVEKRIENGVYVFRLKGDANEDPDQGYVEASKIAGKVCLVIPFSILYSPYGYVLIVLMPLALLALNQTINIYKFIDRNKRRRRGFKAILLGKGGRRRRKISILDTTSILLFLILVAGSTQVTAPYFVSGSLGFFSDTEMIHAEFTAGQWVIEANVDIDPDTLNLNSEGQWITCYIELPETNDIHDIDVTTIMLECEEEFVAGAEASPTETGDRDEDTVPDLMVKFDRATVIDYLTIKGYGDGGKVTFTVKGELTSGTFFQGSDTITLIQKVKS